ncbi:hypothetical protein ACFVX6_32640 [Streptomyces sp. NPDC058289]|uniref:hypothetical protein n=1 Tax=Streptomyces sp. NPDC058289 TaxID=3346425 RepID=UPI0036F04F0C
MSKVYKPDVRAEFGGPALQYGLGLALRDAAGVEVGVLKDGEVELCPAEVPYDWR